MKRQRIIVIGAGIGGLTVAALLAKTGRYDVLVLEAQTYAGGCAATFYHKGFRFDTGATVIGGLHDSGPHHIVGDLLDIHWPVRRSTTAWRVHLPEKCIVLTDDMHDILRQFPHSTGFWREQQHVADSTWQLAAQGLPWPPINIAEAIRLGKLAISNIREMGRFFPLMNKSVYQWARKHQLHNDKAFMRFL
ncbi:MAG: FAD-dependent oxidoreductase, partial [Chloroflexi bacterium]